MKVLNPELIMTTDPWVGTWRPQKSRRPIGAQYSGPGPKYGIPSATGTIKHDPTKNKAPAYSFGIQHVSYNADSSPGPKYFVSCKMTRMGKDVFPAYSMCFRSKEPKKAKAPGPATYFPEKATKCSYNTPPAYTMGSKTKHFKMDSVPGPADYKIPTTLGRNSPVKSSAPCYSLRIKSNLNVLHEGPSPNTYKTTNLNVYKCTAPQYSMSTKGGMSSGLGNTPGPADYKTEKVTCNKYTHPAFTFGVKHSEYMAPLVTAI
ncbi:outer dense fiber protein 3-like isoform X1 [Polyodon spathula]|uniref:outer dense fiber protein 3-like isoform X1 n=2 Tax=Polyodon spathula TaxID=7913 RepID=UPI001B7DEBFB|nr:outer dense fiber protein 3-like isoform X1 [Polyodon spathula]